MYTLNNPLQPLPLNYPITAVVVEDSINSFDSRLTTLQLEYPRWVHGEQLTHRMLARNASSSRAMPSAKLLKTNVLEPVRWGKNQAGMQPSLENLTGREAEEARQIWQNMAQVCKEGVARLSELGLHKQWANRPLEWFSTIKLVVTATEWDNYFELRDHPAAQDEISHLSQAIKTAMNGSEPKHLNEGEWHLPYVPPHLRGKYTWDVLCKVSSACAARTSYQKHDGTTSTMEEDLALFDRLNGTPPHASAFEHCAYAVDPYEVGKGLNGNLDPSWVQFRKLLEKGLV